MSNAPPGHCGRSVVMCGAALIVIVIASLPSWQPDPMAHLWPDAELVDLTQRSSEPQIAPVASRLRMAIAPVISPERTLGLYRGLTDWLGGALGTPVTLVQRCSYAEINDLVRRRRCELAFVCTYAYLQGAKDFGMEVLVVPVVNGKTTYRSLLVVSRGSEARSLLDLRGCRFACPNPISNTGWLYPAAWLRGRGERAEVFFGEVINTRSHDNSILAVADGLVDAAAVDNLVYEQLKRECLPALARVKVIQSSPPFGIPPVVVPAGLDPLLRARFHESLTRMHESPRGRKVLKHLGIDRFVSPPPGLYDSVRENVRLVESGE